MWKYCTNISFLEETNITDKTLSVWPRGVAVLHSPEADPWLAHRAGKGLDDASHEALDLQEVGPADTWWAIYQEDYVCCSNIITPA